MKEKTNMKKMKGRKKIKKKNGNLQKKNWNILN